MEIVTVDLGDRSYDILIGRDCLRDLGDLYVERGLGETAAIVTNPTVAALYLDTVQQSLAHAGVKVVVVTVPDGEQYKTLETAGQIYGDLIAAGLDRKSCVVTLGGGVVGDMAGFVAATYLRGVDFVQVPTTLEAQVDASVGGQNSRGSRFWKEHDRCFSPAKVGVLIDTATLDTLPKREVRAGMAEVIKHGIIRDPGLVAFLEDCIEGAASLSLPADQINWLVAPTVSHQGGCCGCR